MVLCGGVGNGKTHMAIACGTATCRMGMSIMFTKIADPVMRMHMADAEGPSVGS